MWHAAGRVCRGRRKCIQRLPVGPTGTSEAAGGKFNLSLQPFQNARWLDDVAATEIVAS